jgi:hypothetical protein
MQLCKIKYFCHQSENLYSIIFVAVSLNKYLNKECNCNALKASEFYNAMQMKGDELVVVSTTERQEFIKSYLAIAYKQLLNSKPKIILGNSFSSKIETDELNVFEYKLQ